ncbi:MAG: hypothetical protein AB2L07_21320 [Thermoanaerobaculaceae bacterium]
MSVSLKPSTLCVVVLSLWSGLGVPSAGAQTTPAPTARPASPDTEVRIGQSVLGWRAPSAQPGLAELTLSAGSDGAAVLKVVGGRSAGTVKVNLHEGRWPSTLVLELGDARNLVLLSICDFRWCVETSLGSAPQTTARRRKGQHPGDAGAPPIIEVPIEFGETGLVATLPLDWLGPESASVSIHWDKGSI